MIFNDFLFLFVFLPLVLALFFMPGLGRLRVWMLIVASFVFYSAAGVVHAAMLAVSIIWVFVIMRPETAVGSKPRLLLAIALPVSGLIWFKYAAFLLGTVLSLNVLTEVGQQAVSGTIGHLDVMKDIVVPAGISFFTFHLTSYAIDRYRGEIEAPPFGIFTLFISFFPQLVAGPIVRLPQVRLDLEAISRFRLTYPRLATAMVLLVIGLGLKVIVADGLARMLTPLMSQGGEVSADVAFFMIAAYSLRIYFDFYGYSLAAIGIGHLFGVTLPPNFNRPYAARNPRDFWRRWHMSLSYWIRDYIYLPLGGNQSYARNILITFALCGLWHGAGWNFVVWGLYHAFLVLAYTAVRPLWDRLPDAIQIALNLSLVSLGWVFFMFDMSGATALIASLFGAHSSPELAITATGWAAVLLAFVLCQLIQPEALARRASISTSRTDPVWIGAALPSVFVASVTLLDLSETFIYFRF